MKKFRLLLALSVLSTAIAAQPTLQDVLVGEWTGALEYLDYQDNTSRVSLPTDLSIKLAKNKLKFRYAYLEPTGRIVRGKDRLTAGPKTVKWGGSVWDIESTSPNPIEEGWEMVLSRQGMDDNRPATLRQTITRKKDELTILREVKYEKGDAFSFRSVYRFGKKPEPLKK